MTLNDIDKIYFLHLSDRYDREHWLKKQIRFVEFPEDKVNIWWTCRRNFFNDNERLIQTEEFLDSANANKLNPKRISGIFNCALEHYTIIRTSYDRGYENILIFEDDINFFVKSNVFEYFLNNVPENYKCIKFYNRNQTIPTIDPQYSTHFNDIPDISKINNNNLYSKHIINDYTIDNSILRSTAAYMLDRQGMEELIKIYNHYFPLPCDILFNYLDYVYLCNYKLVTTQDLVCDIGNNLISDLWDIDTNKIYSNI